MNSVLTYKNAQLRVGIIGYGKVGRVRHECVRDNRNLRLLGICDTDPEVLNPLGEILQNPGGICSSDFRSILNAQPDLVFVCTPNCYIPEIAIEAIVRGIHVFGEKPPGRNVEDAKAIHEATKISPGVKVQFGFNHRYHAAVCEAKAIVDSGRLGKVMWMRGIYGKAGGPGYDMNWRNNREMSGGGILIDQGIHMVDLMRFFAGEYDEIRSFVGRAYWRVDVEDNVFALLRNSETGQTAMIHSSATQWRHKFLLEIYLERGYLEIEGILSSTKTYGRESLKIARCMFDENGYPLPNPRETVTYYDSDNSWADEVGNFVRSITDDKPVYSGGIGDAIKTMTLVQSIYSADNWCPKQSKQKRCT